MHLIADWRTEVRWRRYEAEARARGVKIVATEMSLPEVPTEQNFADLPMFRAVVTGGAQRPMAMSSSRPLDVNAVKGERMDWLQWQEHFLKEGWIPRAGETAPEDVLLGLEHFAPQMAEWRQWRQRPQSRFPLDLKRHMAVTLSHLGTLQDASRIFTLRLQANLAVGNSAAAFEDFQDAMQAHRAIRHEPTMISGLTRSSVLINLLNAVGEGLKDEAWNETELQKIEAELASISVWEDCRLALASERAMVNAMHNEIAAFSVRERIAHFSKITSLLSGNPQLGASLIGLIPRRVFRDNQLRQNQYFDELTARVSADGWRYDPNGPTPSDGARITGYVDTYYFFLARISAPVYASVTLRYESLASLVDRTRVAIALERFRLAHGSFPETLDELVPQFLSALPVDLYTQKPLIYRRKEGGTFLLYGVGKNRVDDGGKIEPKEHERRQKDDVWLYAPVGK
jgi:hypothetical protein